MDVYKIYIYKIRGKNQLWENDGMGRMRMFEYAKAKVQTYVYKTELHEGDDSDSIMYI